MHIILLLRRLLRYLQWQQQTEAAAHSLATPLQPRDAFVLPRQVPHKSQAQSSASLLLVGGSIDLLEGLEQLLGIRLGHAWALIDDSNQDRKLISPQCIDTFHSADRWPI